MWCLMSFKNTFLCFHTMPGQHDDGHIDGNAGNEGTAILSKPMMFLSVVLDVWWVSVLISCHNCVRHCPQNQAVLSCRLEHSSWPWRLKSSMFCSVGIVVCDICCVFGEIVVSTREKHAQSEPCSCACQCAIHGAGSSSGNGGSSSSAAPRGCLTRKQ